MAIGKNGTASTATLKFPVGNFDVLGIIDIKIIVHTNVDFPKKNIFVDALFKKASFVKEARAVYVRVKNEQSIFRYISDL